MSLWRQQLRRVKRGLGELGSYLDFDRASNKVVRRSDFSHCPRPVLLLYGFFSTRRVFEVLEHRLRRDGFCVWSINLGGLFDNFNTHGIDESAERVREKVERLYARYPSMGPLSIVGHSKGGLIGRYYVKRLGGDQRVRNLVTLGTPHNGTPTAYLGVATLGLIARSVWQMTPMSPFIRRLKLGAFPANVRFTSIYSRDDAGSPFPACMLETEGQDQLRNLEISGINHRAYLHSRTVYEAVRRELLRGYADPAADRPTLVRSGVQG